jgi:hypothetical protein
VKRTYCQNETSASPKHTSQENGINQDINQGNDRVDERKQGTSQACSSR